MHVCVYHQAFFSPMSGPGRQAAGTVGYACPHYVNSSVVTERSEASMKHGGDKGRKNMDNQDMSIRNVYDVYKYIYIYVYVYTYMYIYTHICVFDTCRFNY